MSFFLSSVKPAPVGFPPFGIRYSIFGMLLLLSLASAGCHWDRTWRRCEGSRPSWSLRIPRMLGLSGLTYRQSASHRYLSLGCKCMHMNAVMLRTVNMHTDLQTHMRTSIYICTNIHTHTHTHAQLQQKQPQQWRQTNTHTKHIHVQ